MSNLLMRAGLVVFLALFFGALVIAAIPELFETREELAARQVKEFERRVVRDPMTGCQYIRYGDRFTPRLNSDGKPICK